MYIDMLWDFLYRGKNMGLKYGSSLHLAELYSDCFEDTTFSFGTVVGSAVRWCKQNAHLLQNYHTRET